MSFSAQDIKKLREKRGAGMMDCKKALQETGEIDKANNLLGRDFCLSGKVKKGKQLGSELGFPTANLTLDEEVFLPTFGVYYGVVEVDKKRLLNMLEPGDIILSYSEGYMSNLFLPGIFKHGMVFVGIRHEWDQEIWSKIKLTDKQKTLVKPKHDLIEAIAEGVVSSALADILDSKINRLAVFRSVL